MKNFRWVLVLILLLAAGGLCFAGGNTEGGSGDTKEEVTEFVYAHNGPIRTLDAPVTWYGSTHWLANLMYDCLIWRKADGSGYYGQAAETWENIDPVTWRFHLREGLTFHNGEPLDANAVKWNIDRVKSRKDFLVNPQWDFIKEVIVIDEVTLDIITHEPHAYFEYDVCYNGAEILPPGYIEEVGEEEFARHPVGSGPYKFKEMVANERYVFEAWDDYHAGRPEVDRIVYQIIPEKASQVAALLAGQVDCISAIPIPDVARLQKASDIDVVRETSNKLHLLYLRTETESGKFAEKFPGYVPVTADKNIRHAISHAIDRRVLADVQGLGKPLLVRVPESQPETSTYADLYASEEAIADWYDPDLSRQLIKKAGYDPENGNKPLLHFDSPALYTGNEKEVAEVLTTMLEDVGFEVDLRIYEKSAYFEQVHEPGYNREIILETTGGSPSIMPLFYLSDWWESVYHVDVPEWDKVSREIMVTTDYDKRIELWGEFWEHFVDFGQTVPLYEIEMYYGINNKFNWAPRTDGWMTFRDLTINK